jgi:hypothetical protein
MGWCEPSEIQVELRQVSASARCRSSRANGCTSAAGCGRSGPVARRRTRVGASTPGSPPSELPAIGASRSPAQPSPVAWLLRQTCGAPFLAILFVTLTPAQTQAQGQPFVFNVTTGSGDADSSTGRWLARYDAGYAEQSAEQFGYDGFEQRLGVQGKLGAGLTVLGQMGFGMAADGRTASTQEGELLKDVLPASSRLRVAGGLGMRREWSGHGAALGRIVLGFTSGGTSLVGNVRFEKPLEPGRHCA